MPRLQLKLNAMSRLFQLGQVVTTLLLLQLCSNDVYAARPKSPRHTQPRTQKSQERRSTATFPPDVEETRGYRYAQLPAERCYEELETRRIAYVREPETLGVDAPTRLVGPLHSVAFRVSTAPDGAATPFSVFDCRLVLALDDFSSLLREQGIAEVWFSSAYRPPPKGFREGQQGRRHSGGLAIDIHRLKTDDGETIDVEKDFHGKLGAPLCGKRARPPAPATPQALHLRKLVCGAADARIFQSILTPNYDRPHKNHFHLELAPEVRWFILS